MGYALQTCGFALGAGIAAVLSSPVAAQLPPNQPASTHAGSGANAQLGRALANAGDVNGDGIADYFAGSPGSSASETNAGAVFLRSGASGAVLATYLDIGSDSFGWSIARAGDFDADGVQDFVIGDPERFVGCMKRGAFHIFSGAGGFQIMGIFGDTFDEQFGWALANAGDVDGDGVSDLLVGAPQFNDSGGSHNGRVLVFSGATAEVLFVHVGAPGGKLGFSVVAAGDVNGDGYDDIAAAAPMIGKVFVLDAHNQQIIRTINGSAISQFGWSMANAGDLNGDGIDELAIGAPFRAMNLLPGRVSIHNGASGQALRTIHGAAPLDGFGHAVGPAGDVNGDGVGDLLVSAPWLENAANSIGLVSAVDPMTGQVIRQFKGGPAFSCFGSALCAAGDVNGDGYADMRVGIAQAGAAQQGAASLYLGGGNTPGFGDAIHAGTSVDKPTAVIAVDLNGDGRDDVAAVSNSTSRIDILLSNGNGALSEPVRYVVGPQPTSIAAADFDGDGLVDLAVTLSKDNKLLLMRQNSNGTFSAVGKRGTGKNPSAVVSADFNRDGWPDLAVANRGSDNISVFINSGASAGYLGNRFKTSKKYAVKDAPTHIAVGDVNGDTLPDLVVVNSGSTQLSTRLGSVNGSYPVHKLTTLDSHPSALALADFNGDGLADVATLSQSMNSVTVRLSAGNGTFVLPQAHALPTTPASIIALDADYDGRADLATVNADATISLLRNLAPSGFGAPAAWPVAPGPVWIAVGDIDGDGDGDLVSASTAARKTSVLLNQWF